jgi:hypothetical protein
MRRTWPLWLLAACSGAPSIPRATVPARAPAPVPAPPLPAAEITAACELPTLLREDGLHEVREVPPELVATPTCRSTYVMSWLAARPDHMAVGNTDRTGYWADTPLSSRDDGDTLVLALRGGADDLRCPGDGEHAGAHVDIDLPDQQPGPSWAIIHRTERPIRFEYRYAIGDCTVERHLTGMTIHLGPFEAGRPKPVEGLAYQVIGDVVLVHVPFDGESFRYTEIAVPVVARRVVIRRELQPAPPPHS